MPAGVTVHAVRVFSSPHSPTVIVLILPPPQPFISPKESFFIYPLSGGMIRLASFIVWYGLVLSPMILWFSQFLDVSPAWFL